MSIRRRQPPSREELLELARRLTEVDHRQARSLAELSSTGRCAERARARVLRLDMPGVVDLLAALDFLADHFPVSVRTPAGAAALTAAGDLLIATHGRDRLTGGQRLTLSRAAVHALDSLSV